MAETTCPWCESHAAPVPTNIHLANFQYTNPLTDPSAIKRNPAMCPECFGVGGWVDWGISLHA